MKETITYQSDDGLKTFKTKEECEQYESSDRIYVVVERTGTTYSKPISAHRDYQSACNHLGDISMRNSLRESLSDIVEDMGGVKYILKETPELEIICLTLW